MSVDGTECPIQELNPFSPIWYSHKLNDAGLRYEIGISLGTGNIVWANGPYRCGDYTDLMVFRDRLKSNLDIGEQVLAYSGYPDFSCCLKVPGLSLN